MRLVSVFGGFGLVLGTVLPAAAAPATPEEAASVKSALERYLGGAEGGTSAVTVTPDGDHYAVAIDLKRAMGGLEALGFSLNQASYTFSTAPANAGLWHVFNAGLPRLTIKHGDQSYGIVVNGGSFDGLYDPALPAFRSSTFNYESMSVAVVGPEGGTQTREVKNGKQMSMATPTGEGVATIQVTQTNDGFSQDVDAKPAQPDVGNPGADFSLKSTTSSGSFAAESLHVQALADLWAFGVAHAKQNHLDADQEKLRAILRQALPLFSHLTQAGSADNIVVDSPVGTFAAQTVKGEISLTGLVANGEVGSDLRFAGLTIPKGLAPDWADGLLPTAASVEQSFSGFHLDEPARQFVDSFDLNAKEPFTPEVLDRMKAALGPLDGMTYTLGASHLTSRLVNLDLDGTVGFVGSQPKVHMNLHATGLDAALADLQAKGAGDPTASQVVAVLVLAKGLAKTEPDGKMTWAVDRTAAGAITVNGLTLPGSPSK